MYLLYAAVAWFSSDKNGIRYVLPVCGMTSRVSIFGHTAHGVGNSKVGAVLKQVVNISNVFARGRHV